MMRALWTAASGLEAQQFSMDVLSNNLANTNTTAFAANQVSFQDLFSAAIAGPSAAGSLQLGRGVLVSATNKTFAQGPLQNTGGPLDVAIEGNGFFQVTQADGAAAYTRDGSFQVDAGGRLVTAAGLPVQPAIVVPPGATSISIATDGTVTATIAGSPRTVGQLTLIRFPNPPGLTSLGGNLYAASAASGNPTTAVPGQGGTGTLVQGFLEGSNVNPTTELVNLLIAQQTFAANSQAIVAANQMLIDTVGLVS